MGLHPAESGLGFHIYIRHGVRFGRSQLESTESTRRRHAEEHPLRLGLGPHVGISWLDIDQSLTASGETVSNGSSWWSVWGGANLDFEFDMKRFVSWMDSIRVYAMGGLGGTPVDGGFMWHVGGGFQFFFTPNIAASIGYDTRSTTSTTATGA